MVDVTASISWNTSVVFEKPLLISDGLDRRAKLHASLHCLSSTATAFSAQVRSGVHPERVEPAAGVAELALEHDAVVAEPGLVDQRRRRHEAVLPVRLHGWRRLMPDLGRVLGAQR